jgi:hypothetical protein
MQGARHRARIQRAVHGAGSQIGVAIEAGCPVAAVAAERRSAAATRNRACGGPGGREPATEVPPAAAAEVPHPAATEVSHPATAEVSYTASAEMRTAATHPTAEMCTAAAAAHSPAAEVRTTTAAEVCTATAADVCTATAAAMPAAAAPSAGSRIGRARKRDRQNNNGQRPEFCHGTLPSAPRVKKRHDRVFAPYNASTVLRFQNGGSVLVPRPASNDPAMPCAFANEPESNTDGSATRSGCCEAFSRCGKNLTSPGLLDVSGT